MDVVWLFWGALGVAAGAVCSYAGYTLPATNRANGNTKRTAASTLSLLGVGLNTIGAILVSYGAALSIESEIPWQYFALLLVSVASVVVVIWVLRKKLKAKS